MGGDCIDMSLPGIELLAGESASISINFGVAQLPLQPNDFFASRGEGWPEGASFEIGIVSKFGDIPIPDPHLINELEFDPYVYSSQYDADKLLREGKFDSSMQGEFEYYSFAFSIPEAYAGHTFAIRATLDTKIHGELVSRWKYVNVVAPCSDADNRRIMASKVKISAIADNFEQAAELTDQMLAEQLDSEAGLFWGEYAYREAGRFEDALNMLDRMYNEFGQVAAERNGVPNPVYYQNSREQLLQKIREQER